jgi:hypothetical protein
MTSQIRFRLEPRWTPRKRQLAEAANAAVQKAIAVLAKTHRVEAILGRRMSGMSRERPSGLTAEEQRRFSIYWNGRKALEGRRVPVPDYETARYSLFSLGYVGWDDAFHIVYPSSAVAECYRVDREVRALLAKGPPPQRAP